MPIFYNMQIFVENVADIIKRNAAFRLFAYGKDISRYQIRFRVTFNAQRLDLKTGYNRVFLNGIRGLFP